MFLRPLILALSLSAVLGWAKLLAEPVRPYQRVPVDVRRTTLIVSDIDRSLAFYRDALGLKLIYDQVIKRPAPANNPAAGERSVRLALLRANDTFVGLIGLLEYENPRLPENTAGPQRPGIGDVIMIINAKDLERRFETVRATPGVTIASEPTLIEYPSADGAGVIPVMVSSLWDPDGYFVEVNQILGDPAGTEPEAAAEESAAASGSGTEPEAGAQDNAEAPQPGTEPEAAGDDSAEASQPDTQ